MGRDVKAFGISRTLMGETLTARVLILDEGLHVSVYGGSRTHIGAVSIVDPEGRQTDVEFPGHKDGVIAGRWASAFGRILCPVVVEAGIHYDALDRKGIQEVLQVTDEMLDEAVREMTGGS